MGEYQLVVCESDKGLLCSVPLHHKTDIFERDLRLNVGRYIMFVVFAACAIMKVSIKLLFAPKEMGD